jgi:hypothetical protein
VKDSSQQTSKTPEVVEVDGEVQDGLPASTSENPPELTTVKTEPYNHRKQQEIARRNIAYSLVLIVFCIIIFSFVYLCYLPLSEKTRAYVDNLVLILEVVFGPIITLTGTAIGYYFGANSKKES